MSDHNHDHECAHCAAIAAGMSEEEAWAEGRKHLIELINDKGIAIVSIGGDFEMPSFVHTVGFHSLGFPEVILFGINDKMAAHFINMYHAELLAGTKQPGQSVISDYFNLPVQVIEVDTEQVADLAWQTFDYYMHGHPENVEIPRFVQWVFCDRNGRFPWEASFTAHFRQPVLGEPPVPGMNADHAVTRTFH
jgi:hypothetical protein